MSSKPLTGESLSLYCGEFLISPVPIELSGNWCSHHCNYCFANLNKPGRWLDVDRTVKQIQRAMSSDETDRLVLQLLREGYPVLCSNRVDPFATSNYQQMVPIIRTLNDCGIQVAIQTRGGKGADSGLQILSEGVWYISICQDNDRLRKQVEPGAPTIESRFGLITKAANKGHNVIVGMNPLVADWIPEPHELLKRARDSGAKGVWLGWLHFNHDQIAAMPERDRRSLEPWLEAARKRHPDSVTAIVINEAVAAAEELGLRYYVSGGYPSYGGLWELYREKFDKTFPTSDDWSESCARMSRADLDEAPIEFAEYWEYMRKRLPIANGTECRDYIRIRRQARMQEFREAATYREVMTAIWQSRIFKQCPANHPGFAWLGEKVEGDEWISLTGDDGLPLLVYGHPESDDCCFVSDWRSSSWHLEVEAGGVPNAAEMPGEGTSREQASRPGKHRLAHSGNE